MILPLEKLWKKWKRVEKNAFFEIKYLPPPTSP